jgi:hypothetical protein
MGQIGDSGRSQDFDPEAFSIRREIGLENVSVEATGLLIAVPVGRTEPLSSK